MSSCSTSPAGASSAPDARPAAAIRSTRTTEPIRLLPPGRPWREWTAEEDAVVRKVAAGQMSRENGRLVLGCGVTTLERRIDELGGRATHEQPAPPALPAGWHVIARNANGKWTAAPGAPVTRDDARRLVAEGRATTTQRRTPSGFDLLFRWAGA